MYWKIDVLTKTGKELHLNLDGPKNYILANLELDGLTVIDVSPDFVMTLRQMSAKGTIPGPKLGPFFIDFSRMLHSGLSVDETARTLSETTMDPHIKTGLGKIRISINDGYSLKAAFEEAKIFPKIVSILLDAAEKTGQIPEVSRKLGEYFGYLNENKNRITGSLIYPVTVFIALTAASVVIAINLVPQLGFLLSEQQMQNFPVRFLLGYADFMKSHWWSLIMYLSIVFAGLWYLWALKKEKLMKYVFQVPVIGNVLKEVELSNLFLNLYVYVKSAISLTEALSNIQSTHVSFVTNKLIEINNRINAGATLGEAFEKDGFFPPFIQQSLKKADETGKRTEYFYEIYQYYDLRSKESTKAMIQLINPLLMSLAFAFAGFIASFYILIYQNMGAMGAGIYH